MPRKLKENANKIVREDSIKALERDHSNRGSGPPLSSKAQHSLSRSEAAMEKHKERMRKSHQQSTANHFHSTRINSNSKSKRPTKNTNSSNICKKESPEKRKKIVAKKNISTKKDKKNSSNNMNDLTGVAVHDEDNFLPADFEKLEEQKKCPSGTLPSWDAITVIEYNFDSEQINESRGSVDQTETSPKPKHSLTSSLVEEVNTNNSISLDVQTNLYPQYNEKLCEDTNEREINLKSPEKSFINLNESPTFPQSHENILKEFLTEKNHSSFKSEAQINTIALHKSNSVLPEDPIILHIPDSSSMLASNESTNTNSRIGDTKSRYSFSGTTSEKRETKDIKAQRKRNRREKSEEQVDDKKLSVNVNDVKRDVVLTSPHQTCQSKTLLFDATEAKERFIKEEFLREKVVLDKDLKGEKKKKRQKRESIEKLKSKFDLMSTQEDQASVVSSNFRCLSASERREKLRRVLLKYKQEFDDESPFSDASDDDDSSIDMEWLEKGKETEPFFDIDEWLNLSSKIQTTQETNTVVNKDYKHFSGPPRIRKTQSLRVQSNTREETRNIGNIKTVWKTRTDEKIKEDSTELVSESPVNYDKNEKAENNSEKQKTNEKANVGSMLSMWENRKSKEHAAFDANRDEAFDSSTMGRLKGAKALFENMSKKNEKFSSGSSFRRSKSKGESLEASIGNVKSIFENNTATTNVVTRSQSVKVQSRSSPAFSNSFSSVPREEQIEKPSSFLTSSSPEKPPQTNRRKLSSDGWLDELGSDGEALSSNTTSEDEEETTKKTRKKQHSSKTDTEKMSINSNSEVQNEESDLTTVTKAWEEVES